MSSSVLYFKNLSPSVSLRMHNYLNHESLYFEGNKYSVKTGERMWVVFIQFYYQLMHLMIKKHSQFTFKTTHVKNVCDA
jgi:hypothetical protein